MSLCRMYDRRPSAPDEVIAGLRELPSSIVSDSMERRGVVAGVRWTPGATWPFVAGPALTVRTRPGDNLVVHHALDVALPGEIVVVDAGGQTDRAILGEIMVRYAHARGIAALVVDGAVRDVDGIAAGELPVFACGVSPAGPYKDGPGEIGGPVQVGGTVVRSGDVVVGDADGVCIVPVERAAEILAAARFALAGEQKTFEDIAAGTLDRSWVSRSLGLDGGAS